MLPGRITNLLATYAAYKKHGLLLLIEKSGSLKALSSCDDLGLFMYVPIISDVFSIYPLTAAKIFFMGVVGLFFITTGSTLLLISKTTEGRIITLYGLYKLTTPITQISDVYVAYALPFMAIPLLLLAIEKKSHKLYLASFFVCGLICSFSNIIRIFSGLPVLIFFLIILLFNTRFTRFRKTIPLLFLLGGYVLPYAHFKYVLHQRNTFLEQVNGHQAHAPESHIFWHNMYIGFGYLSNQHAIKWDDSCGEAHARKILPEVEVGSPEYETITRNLIINLIKTDRYFVVTTLFAKLGVILFFFLLYFGFLGLIAAYFVPKKWYIELAFLGSAATSAIPGIVGLPATAYLIGFITCTIVYTIYSILHFLNNNGFAAVKNSYTSLRHIVKTTE